MSEVAKIRVTGLRDFQRALRDMDAGLPKQLRLALNEAANEVIDYAQPRVPRKTGAAAASLKARSSQREARIAAGGRRAPYYPWLDFGGEGRIKGRPAKREFIKSGRYVYKGLEVRRDRVTEIMSNALAQLARDAGLEVS
ncbi:HK97 gp10 family phage protein [Micromonospora sp. NPDC047738]|uniref:HK97 gp10 family phage protein n=1 Tax=Micromonospora sp. NPDC047738 TaxID=3155741 RepID=UPI00340B97DF